MSVRLRLTLWYVAALCVGLGFFAAAVVWQTTRAADATLNTTLRQRAADVVADLQFGPRIILRPDAPDESARRLGEETLWIRVLDPRGGVAVRQGPPFPDVPGDLLGAARIGLYDRELSGERRIRLVVQPVTLGARRVATVQVFAATTQIDAQRRQLLIAMAIAGALIVLGAGGGGLILADRALRPVDRITRLAARIGAGDLHRRVGEVTPERDDELGRLARTFDAMLARLEEADERRRRLTADAAHELATPVATIVSGAEIVLRRPRDAGEYRAALAHNLDEGRHLGRIIDDLLLLARADAGRLPLEKEIVEIDEVCRQAVRALTPLADERAVALRAQLPPRALLVRGDEGRLSQVVRNLLDNALRYTPAGGSVTLSADGGPSHDGGAETVVLRVRDTGPGVAPGEWERIFERFHRGDAGATTRDGSSSTAGAGLGLAICKALVAAHGGRIRVEGQEGQEGQEDATRGAEFVVTLPSLGAHEARDGV